MNRGKLTAARRVTVTLAALVALVAAFAIGGPFTLVVTVECLAALAAVVTLARTPAGVREHGVPRARSGPVPRGPGSGGAARPRRCGPAISLPSPR